MYGRDTGRGNSREGGGRGVTHAAVSGALHTLCTNSTNSCAQKQSGPMQEVRRQRTEAGRRGPPPGPPREQARGEGGGGADLHFGSVLGEKVCELPGGEVLDGGRVEPQHLHGTRGVSDGVGQAAGACSP